MIKRSKYFLYICTVTLLLIVHSTRGYAGTALHDDEPNLYEGTTFSLGAGLGIVKFDTNVKVTDKQSGDSRYLDLEGNLDLPEVSYVTTVYGAYRFNERHSLGFSYFAINRKSSLQLLDESYGDFLIINAELNITDKSRFYNLNYNYSLFHDDRSEISFVAGINGLDLRLIVDASGQITVGNTTRSNAIVAEANVFAPLPLIGLNFGFNFNPEWAVDTKISLVGGSFEDVSAAILQTSINSQYRLSKHTALLVGLTYFNADVTIDDETDITDVSYGYTGAFLGLHIGF